MCLYVPKGGKIETAKEDIVVWKVLDTKNRSAFRQKLYTKGKKHRARRSLRIEPMNKLQAYFAGKVSEGLHSYRTCMPDSSRRAFWEYVGKRTIEMIIPKGAKYVLGVYDDIVSTSLYWP